MLKSGYFLGLDIGTDSVGYAVTDKEYTLAKFHGEPMWGVHLFEEANLCDKTRAFRTSRRRLDRRKQRIRLLRELLADEISKTDPEFYIRQDKSSLYSEDSGEANNLFNDENYTDADYHREYPTIHHLICELMSNDKPHDIRLVYLACAWLVAHRGHFLSDISMNSISEATDFSAIYYGLTNALSKRAEDDTSLPCKLNDIDSLGTILKKKIGITKKNKEIADLLFNGKMPKSKEEFSLNYDVMFKMLCGGSIKMKELFNNDEYSEIESLALNSDDEKIAAVISQIGDDSELILKLKAVFDWAQLAAALEGSSSISESKMKVYEQHKEDLKLLKYIIKKYMPRKYSAVFRSSEKNNYVSYSYHTDNSTVEKTKSQVDFCSYISNLLKSIVPEDGDSKQYNDMMERIKNFTFMPKQKNTDNRVIPHQLYQYELEQILHNAEKYYPSLAAKDSDGFTKSEKIISIFAFRIPYYVGPLNPHSRFAWIKRKADGKIFPWNFAEKVDEDASEQEFIRRMTNRCTYLHSADVLPKDSLLYHRFSVLNEINNIKIDNQPISVEIKQKIYRELFLCRRKVSRKALENYLISNGVMTKDQQISGIDEQIKSDLKPYHDFARLLASKMLTEEQVEEIILRRTCTDEKARFVKWLRANYPNLEENDVKYLAGLGYKDFGRLSREFLDGIEGCSKSSMTGEAYTIISALWNTNDNLMKLLSDKYTFGDTLAKISRDYYAEHPSSVSKRLDEMYLSNAVKRPVIRTLDVVKDIVKVMGCQPERIFVEIARGGTPEQKNKRTQSRKEQILELYAKCEQEDVRILSEQLEALGESADTRLQGEKLFLYFMQFGKCAYSGEHIDLDKIKEKTYDIDHIYPQAFVKDDSIINNKVLVLSKFNGEKSNVYPISSEIRSKMASTWTHWHNVGTISDEKYKRLIRSTGFTEDEKLGFINRQLVETSQSSKAVAEILGDLYPSSAVVYVKARLTSEYRQEFDLLKSRTFNDLHHAKDAYLNIVTGNVYYMQFTRKWFDTSKEYSVNTHAVFSDKPKISNGEKYWDGSASIEKIRATVTKNNAHCTKYAFCRHGGLFDQMPLAKAEGLIPRKAGLPTEKYGGYAKPTVTFFVLTKYAIGKKTDTIMMPVELLQKDEFIKGRNYAEEYAKNRIGKIIGKHIDSVEFPLGIRPIKINTVLSLDGFLVTVGGTASGGRCIIAAPFTMFSASHEVETYIKRLEEFVKNTKENSNYVYDEKYDKINESKNLELYDLYCEKIQNSVFRKRPNPPEEIFINGRAAFAALDIKAQAEALLNMHSVFGRTSGGCDLTLIGGAAKAAATVSFSSSLSNWGKKYNDVRIIDSSASGLYCKKSVNLLKL